MKAETSRDHSLKEIREKITLFRESHGWSKKRLAEESGLCPSLISIVERGERVPSLILLRKISKALKVSIFQLIGGEPQSSINTNNRMFSVKFRVLEQLDQEQQKSVLDLAKRLRKQEQRVKQK